MKHKITVLQKQLFLCLYQQVHLHIEKEIEVVEQINFRRKLEKKREGSFLLCMSVFFLF